MPYNIKYYKTYQWSKKLAYIIGLIATDGSLSVDERHIDFTSKDLELIKIFKDCLKLSNKIGIKKSGTNRVCFCIQFGNKNFYNFLNSIGIYKAKSKTIKRIDIPNKYFPHFLRGCLDGDGNIDLYKHAQSQYMQIRFRFASASKPFLEWILQVLKIKYSIEGGWIYSQKNKSTHVLVFGKTDTLKIGKIMYHDHANLCLQRKFAKYKQWASGGIGIRASLRN